MLIFSKLLGLPVKIVILYSKCINYGTIDAPVIELYFQERLPVIFQKIPIKQDYFLKYLI
jgi:hypothetical protein